MQLGTFVARPWRIYLAGGVLAAAVYLWLAAQACAYIYWADGGTDKIMRANLGGTVTKPLGQTIGPRGVAIDSSHVYWANLAGGTISRANLDGSELNFNFIAGVGGVFGVAVDGQHVYWTNLANGTIGRATLDGGNVEGAFIKGAHEPQGLTVDGQHLYWAERSSGKITRASLDGKVVESSFIAGAGSPRGVAVDAGHLYWADVAAGKIGRADIDGGHPDPNFISSASSPTGVAVDAQHVYWANTATNAIGRSGLDGGEVQQSFIAGANFPVGIAVDPGRSGVATADKESLDFGGQTLGMIGPQQTLSVTNTGFEPLRLGDAALAGKDPVDFVISDDLCSGTMLAVGAVCEMAVSFVPLAVGSQAAEIVLPSDDEAGPLRVPVIGDAFPLAVDPVLSVATSGTGSGAVKSNPAGIDCGSDCGGVYQNGTVVTLTATPAVGSTFSGWLGGDCGAAPSCSLQLYADVTVTALFTADQAPPAPGPGPPPAPRPASPHATKQPKISGSASAGSKLSCSKGVWTGAAPIRFQRQWLRDNRPIPAATGARYQVGRGDPGHSLACRVIAGNAVGQANATSRAVRVPRRR